MKQSGFDQSNKLVSCMSGLVSLILLRANKDCKKFVHNIMEHTVLLKTKNVPTRIANVFMKIHTLSPVRINSIYIICDEKEDCTCKTDTMQRLPG
ncbi:Acylamino-acid-releasing enzyme [Dirofilaria immitis]